MIILAANKVGSALAEAAPAELWDAASGSLDTRLLTMSRDTRHHLDEAMQSIGVSQSLIRTVRGHLIVDPADRWDQLKLVTGSLEVQESTGSGALPSLQEVGKNFRLRKGAHADGLIHVGGNATIHASASALALRHIGGDAFMHDGDIILRGSDLVSNDTELPSLRTVTGNLSPNLSYLPRLFAVGGDLRLIMENTAPGLRYVGRPQQLFAQVVIEPASQDTVIAIIRHDIALTRAATRAGSTQVLEDDDALCSTDIGLDL